jgi:hypothetical protein
LSKTVAAKQIAKDAPFERRRHKPFELVSATAELCFPTLTTIESVENGENSKASELVNLGILTKKLCSCLPLLPLQPEKKATFERHQFRLFK